MLVRKAKLSDAESIYNLYIESARAYPHNLTQHEDEIKMEYIKNDVIQISLDLGLILVAENKDGKIIGSFKSYTSPYRTLGHIMSNTTLLTSPNYEGRKAFDMLMKEFHKIIKNEYQHILLIDGVPHETNKTAIKCYLKNEYNIQCKLDSKILNDDTGIFESEIIISWRNPNFNFKKLLDYHEYLKKYIEKKYKH